MATLMMFQYDVSDPERFAEYNPGSVEAIMATIHQHGGTVLAAGPPDVVTGSVPSVAVCISFPDAAAATAWLNDPEYAPYRAIREEATTNAVNYMVPGVG